MKIFEVKNIWTNGKITKQSLVSKLAYKELELKEGDVAKVEFDNVDKAERFVKYAKSIGLSVKEVPKEQPKVVPEQPKEQPKVVKEEEKISSNKKNK